MHLSKFKVKSEDKDSFTIAHPNGKTLRVEKEKLSKKSHEIIRKMAKGGSVQRFPDGGDVQPDDTGSNGQDIPDTSTQDVPIRDPNAPDPNAVPVPSDENQVPMTAVPQDTGQAGPTVNLPWGPNGGTDQAPAPGPMGPQDVQTDPLTQANNQIIQAQEAEKAANLAGAQATGAMGDAQAKAIQRGLDAINQGPTANDIVAANKDKDLQLMDAYQKQKIDPNRYYRNLSTPAKISAGIASILGGIGGALTHQANPALEAMQRNIDADIDSQKNEQSKAMNLWKMNKQALGTDIAANAATQNQMYTGIQYQIQQAAAQSQNPLATARAQAANAQIDQAIAMNRQKIAIMGGSDVPPEKKIPLVVPPALQKEAFTEAGQARNANMNEADIMKNFDQAASDVRFASGGHPLYSTFVTPPSIKGLQLLGDPLIKDVDGRVNAFEKEDWNKNMPQSWDDDSTVAAKRHFVQSFIQHKKATPILDGHNINTSAFGQLGGGAKTQTTYPSGSTVMINGKMMKVQ